MSMTRLGRFAAIAPLGAVIPTIDQLTQNVARLLQQSLLQASQVGAPLAMNDADMQLARSNVAAMAFANGAGLHGAYRYLRDFIARQAVPVKSTGEFLDGWLLTYGLSRKPAACAAGFVCGTGVAGKLLPSGTLVQADDGRQYLVVSDVAVDGGGKAWASAMAVVAGAAGNLAAGNALTLVSPVVGIDASFTLRTDAPGGGADTESDEQVIYRLQQRLANPPMGGCPADYARWALECPGITRAWGLRNPAGATTAGVIIVADGNAPYGLPTLAQQSAVRNYIRDPFRGPPDELFVIVPTAQVLNFRLRIRPDSVAIRAGVTAALTDLFRREVAPGEAFPHSHVTQTIGDVVGEYDHNVMEPALVSGGAFGVFGLNTMLVLGSVAFV